jgi:hypothetical protein
MRDYGMAETSYADDQKYTKPAPARAIVRAAARIWSRVEGERFKRLSAGRATGVSDQMKEAAN